MAAPSALSMVTGLRAPSLQPWRRFSEPAARPTGDAVRVMFLGVSTMLITDGTSTVLTDGFFSRPGLLRVRAGRIRPNRRRIAAELDRFGVDRVDAVVVLHSHFDHALDSSIVAESTGARLIGSESAREIARGNGFPDNRFDLVLVGEPVDVGRFRLTALPAVHSPGDLAPGEIDGPFNPHAKAIDYLSGSCYTLHVCHDERAMLIQASANTLPGAVDGYRADTVYLGIGTLGKHDDEFREAYWRQYVTGVSAKRVVPIHWDDYTKPLDRQLVPFPAFFDDMTTSMRFLALRAALDEVDLGLPVVGRLTDPFRT
ncbi:MBL fold metallo-hydrolase [Gordonia sp. HY285]|uniref:MBL fold metallo-hydrolase n=1 Tax=Gordonia liuliyuniae TaxID=2911517 RepID=UPI001F432975|nr:MBL fold metallo-hydrolase [Gordonia liuliyuniae]MCF8609919.1 MBL fold metallo-hydrolase [Gordonia liuliyuniae]